MKTIYLEPDEEITSVVDMLTQVEASEVALIVPIGAQLLQSSINLKLLKREADNLGKNVIIVTADQLGQAIAKKADFKVKDKIEPEEIEDFSPEIVQAKQTQKEDIIDALVEEMEIEENEQLEPEGELINDKKSSQMADIIRPGQSQDWSKKRKSLKDESVEIPIAYQKKKIKPAPHRDLSEAGPTSEIKEVEPAEEFETQFESPPEKPDFLKEFESLKESEPLKEELEEEIEKPKKRFRFPHKIFYIFIGLAIIVAGAGAYLVLPTAEVVISPKTERISFDLEVEGSKDIFQIDPDLNKIPIQLIKEPRTLSRTFPASGEKQLNEKARGIVTIYNEYSSDDQILVATTRFLSTDGKLFRTTKTVEVPGATIEEGKIIASTLDVEVVADQPGAEYNIGPSEFTIPGFKGTPKYTGFYGKSKESMSGGSTEKVKIVTADDLEKAEEALREEFEEAAEQILQKHMPADLKLIEGALKEEITELSADVEEEVAADSFVMTLTSQSQALFFNEQDLIDLIDLNLASRIEKDRTPLPETQKISWDKPAIDWSEIIVSFSLHVQEDAAYKIDEEDLKKNLAGLDEIGARKYLSSLSEIQKATVTFRPFWVKRIPIKTNKIKVIID